MDELDEFYRSFSSNSATRAACFWTTARNSAISSKAVSNVRGSAGPVTSIASHAKRGTRQANPAVAR